MTDCIMCPKEARHQCPKCRKPLCDNHGLPNPGYTPGQGCLAPAVSILDIIDRDKKDYDEKMTELEAKYGTGTNDR